MGIVLQKSILYFPLGTFFLHLPSFSRTLQILNFVIRTTLNALQNTLKHLKKSSIMQEEKRMEKEIPLYASTLYQYQYHHFQFSYLCWFYLSVLYNLQLSSFFLLKVVYNS